MKSSSDSLDLSVKLTRRTARVTISVSAAAWQRDINCLLRYFPVPTKRRDRKVLSAIVSVSCITTIMKLAARLLYRDGLAFRPGRLRDVDRKQYFDCQARPCITSANPAAMDNDSAFGNG